MSGRSTLGEELARAQDEIEAADPSPSRRIYRELEWTIDNCIAIARALLEDPLVGDVDESVVHSFSMALAPADSERVLQQIQRMRRAHFKKLGLPVPKYTGQFPR